MLFNAHHEPLTFTLPDRDWGRRWAVLTDTTAARPLEGGATLTAGGDVQVEARAMLALRRVA